MPTYILQIHSFRAVFIFRLQSLSPNNYMSATRLFLPLFPLGIHFPRKFHDFPAQLHQVNGMLLQFVEQRHCFLLREMATQFLHDLVVVRADASELGMEVGQLRAVFQHRLDTFSTLNFCPKK